MKKNAINYHACYYMKKWLFFSLCIPGFFFLMFLILFSCKTIPEAAELPEFHLISPDQNGLFPDSSPHFMWSNHAEVKADTGGEDVIQADVKYYEIWLDDERIGSVEKGIFHFAETPELEWETTHRWYIVAVDTFERSRHSAEVYTFTVTRAPVLLSPVAFNTCDPVFEFSWDAYWFADKWEIMIDDNDDFSSPLIFEETGFEPGIRDGLYNGDIFHYSPRKGVEVNRDILKDALHYYEVEKEHFPSLRNGSADNWSSAGGGTLLFDEEKETWYVSFRNRSPRENSPGREDSPDGGYGAELWQHTDGCLRTPWTKVWEITLPGTESLGSVSLKKFNGLYYYYFSHAPDLAIYYVTGTTVEELGVKLQDQSTWNRIMEGKTTDPSVEMINGSYYMIIRGDTEWDHYALFRSATPDFSAFTKLAINLHRPYQKRYKDDDEDPGTIVFDRKSGKYIYWGTERKGSDIYWFWTSSYDLVDWKLESRERVFRWFKHKTTARYQAVEETKDKLVILMEWDHDKDYGQGVFLWEFYKYPVPARTYMLKDPLPNGQYWWKVRGYTGDNPCPFSVTGTFYVQ
jgi:hypothetical protein